MTSVLSGKDICEVLKTARRGGIQEIVISAESISVKFWQPQSQVALEEEQQPQEQALFAVNPAVLPVTAEAEQESLAQVEQDLREEELALLMVENPGKYEEMIMHGDLEDKFAAS